MANKKMLFAIFLIVFIDLLGFSVILPLLPFYAETFGATPLVVGLLTATYAAAQLIGAPLLGRLSDRYGRRPILMISIAGNMLGFVLLAVAQNLGILFLARALAGLTGGNISVAQAYISDVSEPKDRGKALGLIGAAFGLGFIIGPAVGGILGTFGFWVPATVSAVLSGINLLLVFFWLPESLTVERRLKLANTSRPPFTVKAMLQTLKRPFVGPLLHTRFFFGLAFAMFQSIFALYAQYRLNLDGRQTGYILAYVGVLSAVTQGFLIGKITARFSDTQIILVSTIIMAIGLGAWAFAPNVIALLIVLIPIAVAGGVLNTTINSAMSKAVAPIEIGGILGLAASFESLTRVISPSLGGLMLEKLGTASPGIFGAIILIWLATYVARKVLNKELTIIPAL
jgi:DHA1 family tetracycline resistance protein-like MFS transporter